MSKDDIVTDVTQITAENNDNSTNNSEVEYDWGKHPNSVKALKKHQ